MANPTTPKEDEPPPYAVAWQEETAHLGRGTWYQGEVPMHVDICYFLDGVHYPGELCPHDNEEYPLGWTV